MAISVLSDVLEFPDPRSAQPDGLLAIGGDLSVPRLIEAYRHGIFPWSVDPITWWSPDPRAVFEFERFRIPRSLGRILRKEEFSVTVNRAFKQVIRNCAAAPRREETWITPQFVKAYTRLHEQGHAHSLECWHGPELVGGIYGVAIGGFFAGESMFHRVPNASKVALCHLVHRLHERGFALFDIQMTTPVTSQLGAVTIDREEYLRRLDVAVKRRASFVDLGL